MSTPTTVAVVAGQIHRLVKGSIREPFNVLATTITSSSTGVTFSLPLEGITSGSYLGLNSEIMYVTSINAAISQAEVQRGMFGTQPVAHTAGTLVEVDWRWFTADVIEAMADDLRSWPDDIFRVSTVDVPVGTGHVAYNVALTSFRHLLAVRQLYSGNERWIDQPVRTYRIDRNLPTTGQFPSGNALCLPNALNGAGTIRVEYAADFTLANIEDITTDLVAAVGLTQSLLDALKYGAASRLLVSSEPARSSSNAQPEPRIAAEVPSGRAMQTGAGFMQLRDKRLKEEAYRLLTLYPWRMG